MTDKLFKIMKGDPVEKEHLRYPLYAFPKYNGFRGYVKDCVVYTASNKPFKNRAMQKAFGRPEYEGLDGEFVVGDPWDGDNSLNRTSSVVTRIDGDIADLKFYVFDCIDHLNDPFKFRYRRAFEKCNSNNVIAAAFAIVNNFEELCAYEAERVNQGWEGVITRDPNAPYKCGRSTAKQAWMGKLKQFSDAEFKIVGFEERMHNGNEATISETGHTKRSTAKAGKTGRGDLGALILETKEGCRFGCGTGFNDAQRANYWAVRDQLIGQFAKVKFHETGTKDVPLLPVFIQIRPKEDMTV